MARTRDADHLTALELEAWSGLLSTHAALAREIDARLQDAHGVTFRAYDVLATLDMTSERRLRMSALAERVVLSPSRMTRVVSALEERGWVARAASAGDGRGAYAELTAEGLAALRTARRTHHAVVRERFVDRLGEADLRRLAATWRRLGTVDPGLDEALASLPTG